MTTFSTNDDNFEKDIAESKVSVLVDFWAEWCGPCKQIGPILEEIAIEHESKIKVLKINIDENPQTPQRYGVKGIPTLLLFKKGKLIDTKVGSLPKSSLETWLQDNL
jgi:thioredoxin 1